MCTSQVYRVVDLQRKDKSKPGRQAYFIYSDKNHDINELYPFPRYLSTPIPCQNCIECRMAKASEWAFRCMKEAQEYQDNIMVTLTYDEEHLPKSTKIDPETGECSESYTLDHRDVQLFMKRLRKKYGEDIKVYGCGEYGSDKTYVDRHGKVQQGTERPHYHIILFNLKVEDLEFFEMSKCEWSNIKNPLFRSKSISDLWKSGHIAINEVNYETCRYVAGYVMKKWKGRGSDEHYMLKGQKPPYTFSSRRPGIGHAFFMRNKDKFINEETFWQKTRKGVVELPHIRYFDKLIDKVDPEAMQQIKNNRIDKVYEHQKALMLKTDIQMHEYIDNKISKQEFKQKHAHQRNVL